MQFGGGTHVEKLANFASPAAQSKYLVGSIRFHQLAQIWFATARQHCLTSCITQAQDRLKISSAGLERIEYFNVDAAPAGKPLVTSKNRSRATHDPRIHRQTSFTRDLECSGEKLQKSRLARECALGKHDQKASLADESACGRSVSYAAGQVVTIDEQHAQPAQAGPSEKP